MKHEKRTESQYTRHKYASDKWFDVAYIHKFWAVGNIAQFKENCKLFRSNDIKVHLTGLFTLVCHGVTTRPVIPKSSMQHTQAVFTIQIIWFTCLNHRCSVEKPNNLFILFFWPFIYTIKPSFLHSSNCTQIQYVLTLFIFIGKTTRFSLGVNYL